MKKIFMLMGVLVVMSAGCARFLGVDAKTKLGTDTKKAPTLEYAQWQAIPEKVSDLSQAQKESLTVFERKPLTRKSATEFEKKFVGLFPWIDLNALSVRDKVFLVDKSTELEPHIKWALFN